MAAGAGAGKTGGTNVHGTPANIGVHAARNLPNTPAFVETGVGSAAHFLAGLPAPDFNLVADPKVLWAVAAKAAEGTAAGSATSAGTAYVVSAEAYKYLKAHRF